MKCAYHEEEAQLGDIAIDVAQSLLQEGEVTVLTSNPHNRHRAIDEDLMTTNRVHGRAEKQQLYTYVRM